MTNPPVFVMKNGGFYLGGKRRLHILPYVKEIMVLLLFSRRQATVQRTAALDFCVAYPYQ